MTAPRIVPEAGSPEYRQLFRIVDGAVRACFDAHPDYIAPGKRARTVRNSIVKRVTGSVIGYVEEVANSSARVRSGSSPADDKADRPLRSRFASGSRPSEPGAAITPGRPASSEASP